MGDLAEVSASIEQKFVAECSSGLGLCNNSVSLSSVAKMCVKVAAAECSDCSEVAA